jgi:hypothetical protein
MRAKLLLEAYYKGLKGKDLRAVWPFYRLPNIKINLKAPKSGKWAKI